MQPDLIRTSFRSALWLGFFGAILWAWWVLYTSSMSMDLDLIGRPGPIGQRMAAMDPRMGAPMARFGTLFPMWAIMMAAMMLPTMVPTLRSYEALMTSANGTRAGWLGVLLGYFAVWVGFAALIAGAQVVLLFGGAIDLLGIPRSPYLAAALLIGVGLFQFSRVKDLCHGVCHSPMSFFLSSWKTGFAGGMHMGLRLGAYCVGCCWGFMVLGFAGGVMNLLWMGLATLFMVFEKLPQIGHRLLKPSGMLLIAGGILVAAQAALIG